MTGKVLDNGSPSPRILILILRFRRRDFVQVMATIVTFSSIDYWF
jgi:hypothetical protein